MRFMLPKRLGTLSGAVPGGSWGLLGAILGRPGRQLGAKLAPKRAPEAHKNDLENGLIFHYTLETFLLGFSWIFDRRMDVDGSYLAWLHPRMA